MKKHILMSVVLFSVMVQANVLAQEQGDLRFGVDAALGAQSSIENVGNSSAGFGYTFVGDYFATGAISIALGYTFFFNSSYNSTGLDVSLKSSTIDFDGKYYFLKESVGVYGLFGLSQGFATIKTAFDLGNGPSTVTVKDNKFAINMGAGIDYYLKEKLFLNGQVKYNLALEQVVLNLGVGVSLN